MAVENSVSIIGRLTADPELRQTQSGAAVCSVRIAVRRPYVDDKTDFFAVNIWSEKAKYLCRYGYKGGRVAYADISLRGNMTTVTALRAT